MTIPKTPVQSEEIVMRMVGDAGITDFSLGSHTIKPVEHGLGKNLTNVVEMNGQFVVANFEKNVYILENDDKITQIDENDKSEEKSEEKSVKKPKNSNKLKLKKMFAGQLDDVKDIKFLNNKEILIASTSSKISKIDTETGNWQFLEGHTEPVLCLATFTDGIVLSGAKDRNIRLWKDNHESSVITGHVGSITSLAASKSGRKKLKNAKTRVFASGSDDKTVKLWEYQENGAISCKWTIQAHEDDISGMDFSPNDAFLATCSADKTIKLWNSETGEMIQQFKGHKRGVWKVVFSPSDQVIASCSSDGTVKVWDIKSGECLKTFEEHDCTVLQVYFTLNGQHLVSTDAVGVMKFWLMKTNECVNTIEAHDGRAWAVAGSYDGSPNYRAFG